MEFEKLNALLFEPLLTSCNERTPSEHIGVMSRPSSWGTHVEILAATSLFQAPIYEYVQSQDCDSAGHWEAYHPLAPANRLHQVPMTGLCHACCPPHFELCYKVN